MAKRSKASMNVVMEPPATYGTVKETARWRFKRLSEKTLMEQARKPMPIPVLRKKVTDNPFAAAAYAELLNTNAPGLRALLRRRAALEPAEGERVLLYDQAMARGLQVFGEQEKFERWLELRIPALENQKPADLMKTATGIRQVADELEIIAHGVFA